MCVRGYASKVHICNNHKANFKYAHEYVLYFSSLVCVLKLVFFILIIKFYTILYKVNRYVHVISEKKNLLLFFFFFKCIFYILSHSLMYNEIPFQFDNQVSKHIIYIFMF